MKTTERQSNFELLRILAMILIIIHHIFVHAITPEMNSMRIYGPGEMFNNLLFYKRLSLMDFGYAFGKIGVALFILITGYFLCSKKDLKISNRIFKIIKQMIFTVLLLIGVSILYNKFIDNSFAYILDITTFYDEWWFICYYFLIIIIANYFINKQISKLSQKEYLILLISLFVIVTFSFSYVLLSDISYHLQVLMAGIFYFLLGGYLKKYNPFKNIKGFVFIFIIIFTLIMLYISYRNRTLSNINYILSTNSSFSNYQSTFGYYYEGSITVMLIAVSLFELFTRINIKNSKIINYVSSAMFMTYLIHDNDFVRDLFRIIDWIPLYNSNMKLFLVYFVGVVLIVLTCGIVSYTIYNLIINVFQTDRFKSLIYKKTTKK